MEIADLKRLLEKLADDKPVIQENCKEEPEVTILVLGQGSWDSGLGTLTRSTGTTLNSLGTVERKSWGVLREY